MSSDRGSSNVPKTKRSATQTTGTSPPPPPLTSMKSAGRSGNRMSFLGLKKQSTNKIGEDRGSASPVSPATETRGSLAGSGNVPGVASSGGANNNNNSSNSNNAVNVSGGHQSVSATNLNAMGAGQEELPQLYVRIESARGLPPGQTGFAYCTINLEGINDQTRYVLADEQPRWDEEFVLVVMSKMSCLEVTLFLVDEEGSETQYYGEVDVSVSKLAKHKPHTQWFSITSAQTDKPTAAPGELRLTLYNSLQRSPLDALRELQEVYRDFLTIVTAEMPLLSALFFVIDPTDADRVASSVMSMFWFLDKEHALFEWAIRMEVDATASPTVLFRSNSMAIRLVSMYAKTAATPYLKALLLPLIEDAVSGDPTRFEVDPNRLPGANAATLKRNQKNLEDMVTRFLESIVLSVQRVPRALRRICQLFVSLVGRKFPNDSHKAVGAFLFLRFICPAIVAPSSFGLLQKHPTGAAHRALVLVAKVLQNVANFTQFKEPEMEGLNPFVEAKQAQVQQFLASVAVEEKAEGEPLAVLRPTVVADSCVIIARLLRQHLAKIRSTWEEEEMDAQGVRVLDELEAVLRTLTESEMIHEKPYNASAIEPQLRKDGIVKLTRQNVGVTGGAASILGVGIGVGGGGAGGGGGRDGGHDPQDDVDEDAILNMTRVWQKPYRPGCAKDLVAMALSIYLEECKKANAAKVKAVEWSSVSKTADFKKFELAVCELQRVDLQQLLSVGQKTSFWLNVYHALQFHILFTQGAPGSAHALKLFMTGFVYRIGQYVLSLSDIENGVLRGNLGSKLLSRHWQDNDPRRQLSLLPVDLRAVYALSNLSGTSAIVQPYGISSLDSQLSSVLNFFLDRHVEIDARGKVISLPKQFSRMAVDFGSEDESREATKALLQWMFRFLSAKKKLDVLYLQGKTCTLNIAKKADKVIVVPRNVLALYQAFQDCAEQGPEELPDVFNQGVRTAAAPDPTRRSDVPRLTSVNLRAAQPNVLPGVSSPPLSPVVSSRGTGGGGGLGASADSDTFVASPLVSTASPVSPPPPKAEGAGVTPPTSSRGPPPLQNPDVARRLERQASVFDENILRESLSSFANKIMSDIFECQTIVQHLYSECCRTVSVTTAFNVGKFIRQVKLDLLEVQGVTWRQEDLDKYKQQYATEPPALTRLQLMEVTEAKQEQLKKLLEALNSAVTDIRFLLDTFSRSLPKRPDHAAQLSKLLSSIRAKLSENLQRVVEKNLQRAQTEELLRLEEAITPEIDKVIQVLQRSSDSLVSIDLQDMDGRRNLLYLTSLLTWMRGYVDAFRKGEALPAAFRTPTFAAEQLVALEVPKLQDVVTQLKRLIEKVVSLLDGLKKSMLNGASREKLGDVANVISCLRDVMWKNREAPAQGAAQTAN